ncbi:hypothetical protein a20_67 [Escherichia phage a20]|nr:hypothetical protein a20_67 [Escherichia phage a20]
MARRQLQNKVQRLVFGRRVKRLEMGRIPPGL